MISHHNAVNTILDINDRYQITEQDTDVYKRQVLHSA